MQLTFYIAAIVAILSTIMVLNLKGEAIEQEKQWLTPAVWIGPAILSFILFSELVYILITGEGINASPIQLVDSKAVGKALYGPYILGVELSGMFLMAGIVGAYHLGRQKKKVTHRFLEQVEE